MPTLNWIGKEKVINHHQDVPYRILEKQYTYSNGKEDHAATSENKIIHGDNLEALKSLLPEYEGKIKCIYIDPPYNTGNEGWVYNDNVSHPKLKKWLGQVVGKESEDLSRHDKWLCMMYPRLKLLNKLLDKTGVLCISIDDNSNALLKLICEEIFGINNHLGAFVWKRRVGSSLSSSWISADHEYVVVYSKNPDLSFVLGDEKDMNKYSIEDKNGRKFASMPLTVGMTKEMRPNQWYALKHPDSGNEYWPTPGRVWCYYPPTMEKKIIEEKILWPEDDLKGKRTTPRLKSYPEDAKSDRKPLSTWIYEKNTKLNIEEPDTYFIKSGKNQEGAKMLKSIFGESVFNFSKPISLLERLFEQFCPPNGLVLDSFAGSGSSAQAVLNINKKDGGNRKFILIEMEEYANDITAERVKRVIKGYGKDKKAVAGTGGDFTYYELGEPIFLENELLNEAIGKEKIEEYVWYSETKTPYTPQDEDYLLGSLQDTAYYFYYERERLTTLDEAYLRTLKTKAQQYIIYADLCLLDTALMDKYHIVFKKIPRDISRF